MPNVPRSLTLMDCDGLIYAARVGRSVVVRSFRRICHATGLKAGCGCAPKTLSEEVRKVHQ